MYCVSVPLCLRGSRRTTLWTQFSPGSQTQKVRLDGKHLHMLSQPTAPLLPNLQSAGKLDNFPHFFFSEWFLDLGGSCFLQVDGNYSHMCWVLRPVLCTVTFAVLGIEAKDSYVLGKHSAAELNPALQHLDSFLSFPLLQSYRFSLLWEHAV